MNKLIDMFNFFKFSITSFKQYSHDSLFIVLLFVFAISLIISKASSFLFFEINQRGDSDIILSKNLNIKIIFYRFSI